MTLNIANESVMNPYTTVSEKERFDHLGILSLLVANSKSSMFGQPSSTAWTILIVVILVILFIIILLVCLRYRRQRKQVPATSRKSLDLEDQ